MIRYAVRHETHYSYGTPVDLGFHLLRLTPLTAGRQRLVDYALSIRPEPARYAAFRDHFGNAVHHVAIERAHDTFTVVFDATVEIDAAPAAAPPPGPPWEAIREAMRGDGFPDPPAIAEFVQPSPLAAADAAAAAYAAQSFPPGRPVVDGLRELAGRIRRDFAYMPGSTDITTPVAQVMETRRGVCQDFAHAMISGLRGIGLPARYVSGYIRTYPPEGEAERRGADASHAWVSAWCGAEIGWVGVDPTNDLVEGGEHIVVAHGRDYSDVAPLRGVILGGGAHSLQVAVTVTPV